MNKPVVARNNHVAPIKAAAWPDQRTIKDTAAQLDTWVRYNAELERVCSLPIRNQPLVKLTELLDYFSSMGGERALKLADERLNALEPEEWRDEDFNIQRAPVSKMLAYFVGSFPTSNLPDAVVFTKAMLNDVLELNPGYPELESACRRIRQSQKFMPAICELLAAIRDEKKLWARRWTAIDLVEGNRSDLAEMIADERARLAKANLPIGVGSGVFHQRFGQGTVAEIFDSKATVQFSNGNEKDIVLSFLEKREAGR